MLHYNDGSFDEEMEY